MLSQYIVILNLNWKNKMSSELLFSFKNVSSSLAVQGTGKQPRASSGEASRCPDPRVMPAVEA